VRLQWQKTESSTKVSTQSNAPDYGLGRLIKERLMTSVRNAEKTYRAWSSPILLELKAREHQMDPASRQALENILVERRLIDLGHPTGTDRRKTGRTQQDKPQ
jgi:hypothetical protein